MSGSALLFAALLGLADDPLHLAVGDAARRDREVPLVLDAITDASTGGSLTPEEWTRQVGDVRLLFVGESHTSMEFHRVQLHVIQSLVAAGRKVLIGLEMYPYTEQIYLDQWHRRLLTEEGFVALSRWYKNWGYHWNYYRDIFHFAQKERLPLIAVNTPREVVSAVRKKGFKDLTAEEAQHLPPRIDTESAEHFALFKAFFDAEDTLHGGLTEDAMRAMFGAQCTWDATMAYNAVRALEERGDETTILVVLIGSGHVAYGLGIERQARLWSSGKMASLIPVPVLDSKKARVETVRASYANFVWGVLAESRPAYPSLGLSFASEDRLEVIHVEKDSIGEKAGFRKGDVLLTMDGAALSGKEAFNREMASKAWGDAARFGVKRPTGEETLTAYFRRDP